MELKRGQVVFSLSGKDKGTALVTVKTEGTDIYVCDGKKRPLERPKKKNRKHVQATNIFFGEDAMRTNVQLKKAIRALSSKEG